MPIPQRKRIIDKIPAHKLKEIEDLGDEMDALELELREFEGAGIDVTKAMEQLKLRKKQRQGILKLAGRR